MMEYGSPNKLTELFNPPARELERLGAQRAHENIKA
jgi:hypothetical protein